MKIRASKTSVSAESDMTPMIDMTFQLIAFFMVLLNFGEGERDQRIHLPASEIAKPIDAPVQAPLVLQLDRDGMVLWGGERIPVEAMAQKLLVEQQIVEGVDMGSPKGDEKMATANVVIRADGRVPTGTVKKLIAACQAHKFQNFSLRVEQRAPDPAP